MKQITILQIITAIIIMLTVGYCFKKFYFDRKTTSNQVQRTLAIIKPDAVRAKNSGKIIDLVEREGFTIVDLKKITLSQEDVAQFYQAHKDKGFFTELADFMTSGPVIVMVLEKINGIQAWRNLMGATNPSEAKPGTIRKLFGSNVGRNAVHGSDAVQTAREEIKFFFEK
jgi:nucleoside-diphosphate kinase